MQKRNVLHDILKEVIKEELFGVSFDVPVQEERTTTKATKKAKVSKGKVHWMQKPENAKKVAAMVRKMQAVRKRNKRK